MKVWGVFKERDDESWQLLELYTTEEAALRVREKLTREALWSVYFVEEWEVLT